MIVSLILSLQVASGGPGSSPGQLIPRGLIRHATVVYALETGDNAHDLWEVAERSGGTALVLPDVSFMPVRLVGYAAKDSLRLDLPTGRQTESTSFVQLPNGLGRLYRIEQQSTLSIVAVNATEGLRVLHSAPPGSEDEGIAREMFIGASGSTGLAVSHPDAGGNLHAFFPAADRVALDLTANLPPLSIETTSLRTAGDHAWFVAGAQLYLASVLEGDAHTVELPLLPGEVIHPELAIATESADVIVVLENPVTGFNRAVRASVDGTVVVAWEQPAPIDRPNYDNPLGPWLAISADGQLVAFRERVTTHYGVLEELWVWSAESAAARTHVTKLPEFPTYIDNVGILAFAGARTLRFFAGDTILSASVPGEMGAADMFAAVVDVAGPVSVTNVTNTSGNAQPPFSSPGTISLTEAYVDPTATNIVTVSAPQATGLTIGSLDIEPASAPSPNFHRLFENLSESPDLYASGTKLLTYTEQEGDEELEGLSIFEIGLSLPGLPLDTEVETLSDVVVHPTGRFGALVHEDEDDGRLSWVNLSSMTLTPIGPSGQDVSEQVVFSASGRLHVGFLSEGTAQYFAFRSPSDFQVVDLPPIRGFPLGH